MPLFASLRRKSLQPPPRRRTATEAKLILADYYNSLLNAGIGLHDHARPWPVERAVAEGYERVVWCCRAVSAIAENGARTDVPFEVVVGDNDTPDIVEDHPVSHLLNGQANEMETGAVFRERLISQLKLSKRGVFVEVTRSNAGTPVAYHLLPPGRTRIVPGDGVLIDHYEVTRLNGTTYNIEPDRVRWIRHPHPLDPYSGMTPLEAAGYSLELDLFARLYNVSFMRNDGRPGGVLAVDGDLDDDDLDRIESRFGVGPTEAGKLSVVAGKLTYADLGARPRDMAYGTASTNARNEILCAFGVPESVLGNASGRTFSNAQAEDYQFWSTTMLSTLSRVADGFLPDLEDGERGRFNTSRVQSLQLPEAERRAEARAEFEAGLRSVYSYAQLAGYDEEIDDTPYSRALWIPSGRTPMPAHVADAAALGAGGEPAPADGAPPADTAATPGRAPDDGTPGIAANSGDTQTDNSGTLTVPSQRVTPPALPAGTTATPATAAPAAAETKAAPNADGWTAIDPADTESVHTAAVRAALNAQVTKWAARTAARLRSPKTRKGTRLFTPEYPDDTRVGTKALDAAGAVDEDTFTDDIDSATRALITQAALAAAAAWLTAATGKTVTPDTLPQHVADEAEDSASAAMPALVTGAAWQARRAAQTISDVDASSGTLDDVLAAVAERLERTSRWVDLAAEDAVGAATEAGYAAAAEHHTRTVPGVEVQQQWLSRKDEGVRATHRVAHGQMRDAEKPFNVGGGLLRYPRDPLGPPGEVRNCRCYTRWRQRRTGQFTAAPGRAAS